MMKAACRFPLPRIGIVENSGWGRVPETEFLCIIKIFSDAPDNDNPNPVPIGDGFGFLVYLEC